MCEVYNAKWGGSDKKYQSEIFGVSSLKERNSKKMLMDNCPKHTMETGQLKEKKGPLSCLLAICVLEGRMWN